MTRKSSLTLGERLLSARKDNGLSQPQLAEKARVDQSRLSKYERNETDPSTETLARLASVLGVSLDWLITGKEAA